MNAADPKLPSIIRYELSGWDRQHVEHLVQWAKGSAEAGENTAHGTRVMIDMRAVAGFGVPTPYAITSLRKMAMTMPNPVKIALVVNAMAEPWMQYTFMGIRRSGMDFQVFTDDEQASRWLTVCSSLTNNPGPLTA